MKRGTRITLLTLAVLLAVGIASGGGLNAVLSRIASRRVNKVLSSLPDCEASCGKIQVGAFTGTVQIEDVRFVYHSDTVQGKKVPGSEIYIDRVKVGRVFLFKLLDKEALIHSVSIIRPRVELWMDEDQPALSFPHFEIDSAVLKMMHPLKRAELMNLHLEDASFALHSTRTPLDVKVNECSLSMHDLTYDSSFHFCDTLYKFSAASTALCLPDGLTRINAKDINLEALGTLSIGAAHYTNRTAKRREANAPGADIRIARMEVGPLSHSLLLDKQAVIEAVKIYNPRVELWMDEAQPALCFQPKPVNRTKKSMHRKQQIIEHLKAKELTNPFTRAELKKLVVKNASFALHSTATPLDVSAESCSFLFNHLAYASGFTCDSLFQFSLAKVAAVLQDGRTRIETQDIVHQDNQGLSIGATRFSYPPADGSIGKAPGTDIQVEQIHIGPLSYAMLLEKQALMGTVRVVNPRVELWMDESRPELSFPKFEKKNKRKNKKIEVASLLELAELECLQVENASLALHSVKTKLDVAVDSCSLELHQIIYDHSFCLSDSLYRFALGHADILLPDGSMRIETNAIRTENGGPLTVGSTRIAHTMGRMELGNIVQEPTTWIDMSMQRLVTSPLNPIRKIMAKDYTLDHAEAVFTEMDILRDLRYQPKHPFIMVQEAFRDIKTPFLVRRVDADLKHINIDLTSTDINCGNVQFSNVSATAENITNYRNEAVRINGLCPVGKGSVQIGINFLANSLCEFETRMHAESVDASFLNSLIRPLVGMTCALSIDTLDTRYRGNIYKASGTFRMLYHGLKAKVHKEDDIPYKIVTRHAGIITAASNTLIPKSNPLTPHGKPKAYTIEWKRNEWKPTELYIFGPCIDGIKKTLLPGLFIKDRTKIMEW